MRPCVCRRKRETIAKEADKSASVKPFDKFRRQRTPLGEARGMVWREIADALRPVERFFRPRRCFGRSDTSEADVFAAGVGVGQTAKFGEPVGFVAAAATGVTFPSPGSIVALVGRKGVVRILVKHAPRGFLGTVAVAAQRHECGQRQAGFGLCEQIVPGAHAFPLLPILSGAALTV